ncbi:MAG: hypothetical protein EA342_14970 [Leptolyngbya sp. LCM1.Bin17]|nr:MAG: hypothetical protein EA342_14970 [Leptolyngbya sp. LCM1.Bin17]
MGSGLSLPAHANQPWGTVVYANTPQGYALNVRWGPGTHTGVYRRVRRGSPLELSGRRQDGWLQLIDTTWVAGNLVSRNPIDSGLTGDTSRNLALVITPQGYALNIRSGPGYEYQRTGQFRSGSRVRVTGRTLVGWAELATGEWVDRAYLQYGSFVEDSSEPAQPEPDENVRELQRRLRQLGYLPSDFPISGIYDEDTQNAVRVFQRVNGLPVTGRVDNDTWLALYNATSPTPTPTPSPEPGEQRKRVVTDGDPTLVFDGPGTENEILRSVDNGTIVTITGETFGNWSELADGGWIFSLWLEDL